MIDELLVGLVPNQIDQVELEVVEVVDAILYLAKAMVAELILLNELNVSMSLNRT